MKRLSDEAQAARVERMEALKSGAVIQPDSRKSPGVRESPRPATIPPDPVPAHPRREIVRQAASQKAKPDKVESPPTAAQMGYAKVPDWGQDNPSFSERLSALTYRRLYLNVLRVTLSESTGEYAGAHEPDCYTLQCSTLEELERRAKALAADGYTLDIEVRACRDETQNGTEK